MKLERYLTERASKNCIVVDIQPMYQKSFNFKLFEFVDFLENNTRDVLYYFNGPDTVGDDSKMDIMYWLIEEGLSEEKINDITFFDKGYAFFRSFMDQGIPESTIIKMVRYMYKKREWDSRDIEKEEWQKILGKEYTDEVEYLLDIGDMIYAPDINISQLRKHSGGYICGGGKRECLAEVKLLMSAFNFKSTEVKRFIY